MQIIHARRKKEGVAGIQFAYARVSTIQIKMNKLLSKFIT